MWESEDGDPLSSVTIVIHVPPLLELHSHTLAI